jgi:dienelactone hydrolase
MFGNDPLPGSATYQEEKDPSLLEQIKLRAAETAKSFLFDMWLARQTPEKVLPILHKVIEAAKDEFADAVANGGGIYSVGYCFGGRLTLLLASEKQSPASSGLFGQATPAADEEAASPTKSGPYIKAGAIAHATLVTKEDFVGTKVPLSFVCVENDQLFEENIRSYGEKVLKDSGVEADFKVYQGVPHGFGVVGEYQDTKIQSAQKEAFEQILSFLQSH